MQNSGNLQTVCNGKRPSTLVCGAWTLVPRSSPGIRRRPIIEYARGHGVDLIVMGHRGMSNLQRFFVGSVADRVVDHAPCMVLVVRAADNRR